MAWTLCLSGPAIAKAGNHANATLIAYAGNNKTILDAFSDAAEGKVCAACNRDFVTTPSTNAQIINAVKDATEALIAMDICAYAPAGYSSREWDAIMNKNDERYNQAISVLKNKDNLIIH